MKNKNLFISVICFFLLFIPKITEGQTANINLSAQHQEIDGFGVSTAWHGPISDADANTTFSNSNSNQLGMSILRIRIDPYDN